MNLTMQNSPYWIEPAEKPQKAIKLALKMGLLQKNIIDEKMLDGYLKSKNSVPIWVIEASCKMNKKNSEIPIQYQNVWFCLNQAILVRKMPTKIIKPKLNFYSVYIEPSERVISLINSAIEKVGSKTKLAILCGVNHRQSIRQWESGEIRPQLMGFMKICEILKKDVWKVLNGHKMYGHSCPEEESLTFRNYSTSELLDILTWIKLEGHLPLGRGAVETNQKKDDVEILKRFSGRLIDLYKINPKLVLFYDNSIKKGTIKDWEGFKLCISSSPLRQILCLRYGIPLGYKCSFVDVQNELYSCENREDFYRVLSTAIESEGSFTFRRENGYSRPIIGITSASYKLVEEMIKILRKYGYNVYFVNNNAKSAYDLRIQGLDSFTKCCFNIFPYFSHPSKLRRAIMFLSDEKILMKVWVRPSYEIKELIEEVRDKYPGFHKNKNLAEELMKIVPLRSKVDFKMSRHTINGWLNLNKSLPLLAVILLCKASNKNYFKYIPKHLGLVLWTHGFIRRKELEMLRGITNSFEHVEAFKNGL